MYRKVEQTAKKRKKNQSLDEVTNSLLEKINKKENFLPLCSYKNLDIGRHYRVLDVSERETQFGKRIGIVFLYQTGENKENEANGEKCLLFLSESFNSKLDMMKELISKPDYVIKFVLESVRSTGNIEIPNYLFFAEREIPVGLTPSKKGKLSVPEVTIQKLPMFRHSKLEDDGIEVIDEEEED